MLYEGAAAFSQHLTGVEGVTEEAQGQWLSQDSDANSLALASAGGRCPELSFGADRVTDWFLSMCLGSRISSQSGDHVFYLETKHICSQRDPLVERCFSPS